MKKILIVLTITFFSVTAKSQLTKGNWLVGGAGSLSSLKNNYSSSVYSTSSERLDIKVAANLGYFLADNLAIGIRPGFSKFKEVANSAGGGYSNVNRFELGPFFRYYFLGTDRQFNILTDFSYQHGFYWFKPIKGNSNTFSASAGTVVFFNSSVGLELLLGYYIRKEVIKHGGDIKAEDKGLQINIGFQIHLEK